MDFSGVLASVDVTEVLLTMTSIAVIFVTIAVVRWGFDRVIEWFDPELKISDEEEAYWQDVYDAKEDIYGEK